MAVFKMPSLGADMEAGRLVEWMIAPGDTVHRGDVVAAVETQKGAIEIEVFQDGTVQELLADLGQELPVGAPLAVILGEGEAPSEAVPTPKPAPGAAPKPEQTTLTPEPEAAKQPVGQPVPPPTPPAAPEPTPTVPEAARKPAAQPVPPVAPATPGALRISPAARALAAERGVDLASLKGSGPGGAILYADVEHAAKPATQKTSSPLAEMRKAIAAAMTRSKQTIPHFYLSETIDVDPAIAFLEARNADLPPAERVLLGALFIRATVLAAQQVPAINGHYTDEAGFKPSDMVNPGIAIALRGGGLVAPALRDASGMTLDETMAGMRDLVTRARAGRLRASEMTQGTITISSLGETGAESMTGVIFPPQVAIVGIGAPHLRPWVVEGAVVPRHVVTLTLSADHRVSDGRVAAKFIAAFEELMQKPEAL
ncbi:dihydrolipoamide acetyltransferase family protein [Thetidibacter halocola]|uniref:Dihydrolipoamide acetyltransferase component of pyruvate dehydrogenase complex n=1 Tax=Thetidibacter halocola TaxID=2827239 RepID=A0A8J8B8Z5_9RHOB|nr:dihydrolipoamide acetyltransferase family protein [Thetidibacter halocola]MBS0126766.1 2-oxo acid dehydrogenase subunit E2 [Thetidibacter halocola]